MAFDENEEGEKLGSQINEVSERASLSEHRRSEWTRQKISDQAKTRELMDG